MPFTQDGKLAGSRNKFIHCLQNTTDQPQIVRQDMRHVAKIRTGKNLEQVALRALQYNNSKPKGPVYLWAMRKITEEHLIEADVPNVRTNKVWSPIKLSPLNKSSEQLTDVAKLECTPSADRSQCRAAAVLRIATAWAAARKPLIVTTHARRNLAAVAALTNLAELTATPIFSLCVSTVNIAFDHYAYAGVSFGQHNPLVDEANFILILNSNIPW